MIVNIAGAGAGKTTKMADLITEYKTPEGKIVFCIAFTNAAVENIEKKVVSKMGNVPNNIRISTIHSFLYQEIIRPYYYFLFEKQFEQLSVIDLPDNLIYKQKKISELEANNVLHYTKIPERAKWIVYKKSDDTKVVKKVREEILNRISKYCAAIFVDEAQDISEDIKLILENLDKTGINIILYGDPKQDVKGLGQFREVINCMKNVNYISNCYRCPQKHLNISNILASDFEKQKADKDTVEGSVMIVFESNVDNIEEFINNGNYGLKYISKKMNRFITHKLNETDNRFETLQNEVFNAMIKKWKGSKSEFEINREAFYVTEKMLKTFDDGNDKVENIILSWIYRGEFDKLDSKHYAQMASVFKAKTTQIENSIVVRSIEGIKGLEDKNCLFILTTDLAPYLFQKTSEENKTKNLLYVALTRSLDCLTILVTKEVEETYTKTWIEEYFNNVLK